MEADIKYAIEVLQKGGIIIYPTDTAFGIGCVIDNQRAVERLFSIRKRPPTQATPVLVDTVKMAQDYLQPIPKDVLDQLIQPYWPGALTIVLKCKPYKVPELVRGGGNTLGVRIPNHEVARSIIRGVGKPILGPSANFHGGKTPYVLADLDRELVRCVDYVVEGSCSVKNVSTVIDCSVSPWKIIRHGAVDVRLPRLPS
jgi:L-threonylcarbamoyladenylate synthase